MNSTTKAEQTTLTLPQRAAVALGETANEAKLRELVKASAGIVEIKNADARDEAHRAGMVLLKTRTSIAATGKAAREDATAFGKAVIAMEKDLIAIIEPEETRVIALRDAWDNKLADEKAAKIAAERERVELIQRAIQNIRDIPLTVVGKSADYISRCIAILVDTIPTAEFEEFIEQAKAARLESLDKLAVAEATQRAIEAQAESDRQEALRQAAAAEEAHKAEAARIERERAELARQQAAAALVAAETKRQLEAQQAEIAAQRKAVEDAAKAQQVAADELRRKTEANMKAERDAQAEQLRIERERVDAEFQAKQDAFAREQAEFRAQQAAAQAERDAEAAHAKSSDFDEILSDRTKLIREMIGADDTVQIVTYPLSAVLDAPSLEQIAADADDIDTDPEPSHTPGPWERGQFDENLGYDCMTGGIRIGPVVLDGRDYGQTNCADISAASLIRMMADARLISAGPDLLAVAQEVEETAGYCSIPLDICDRLRAAIEKATGRAA